LSSPSEPVRDSSTMRRDLSVMRRRRAIDP